MWQLFTLFCIVSALTCPKYSCTKSKSTVGECISYSNKSGKEEYSITPCEANLQCPFTPGSSSSCSSYPSRTRYPGDYCATNFDCLSLNCNNNVCVGLKENSSTACSSTADCGPGLYCSNTTCVKHKSAGASCTLDEQCQNSNVCDQGSCTLMFSLANGNITNVTWGTFAPTCVSGYAVKLQTGAGYNCSTAPLSNYSSVITCPSNGKCTASDGKTTRECQCGYDSNAYCPLYEGDSEVVYMIRAWPSLYTTSESNCNALHKWSFECFYPLYNTNSELYNTYISFAVAWSNYFNGTWYSRTSAPDCVIDTILLSSNNLVNDYFIAILEVLNCPKYSLVSDTAGWAANQCLFYSQNIYSQAFQTNYFAHSCATGYCDINTQSNTTCTPWDDEVGYPGDYCKIGTDCFSGNCTKNRCTGQAAGQPCGDSKNGTLYCGLGLTCNESDVCESINQLSSCDKTRDCNSTSICLYDKCTLRFSVPNGGIGKVYGGSDFGYSEVCASGFAYYDNKTETTICGNPPTTNGKPMVGCSSGTVTDKSGNFTQNCECGLSGYSYLPVFTGDGKYLANVKKYLKSFSEKISCYRNYWRVACLKIKSEYLYEYYQYFVNLKLMTNGPYYKDSEKNILKFFANDYYNATQYISDESSSSSSQAVWIIAGLGLHLIA